jgi:hypothetical protein
MAHGRTPQPFLLDEPLDYEDGRAAASELNRRRVDARKDLEKHIDARIEAETVYRKARALKRLEVTATDGPGRKEQVDAWTTDEWAAKEKAQRAVDITKEKLEEIDGQRASLHRLIEWSQQLDPTVAEARAQRRVA